MRKWQRVGLIFMLCAVCIFGFAMRATADSVTVTIGVGDTILQVTGKTSPGAFVTIKSDGNVIGTTTAAADGTYTKTFGAQTPGLHQLNIYAHTTSGQDTDTITLNLNLAPNAITTAEAFLPPSVTIQNATPAYNEPLEIRGETFPLSIVKVFVDGNDYITATADAQGNWSASIITSPLESGQHQFFVRVTDTFGDQSYPTALRFFRKAAQPNIPTTVPHIGSPQVRAPSAPVITFPVSGAVWTQPEITVKGLARPNTQIELFDGTSPIGSAWSDANGAWSINLTLQPQEYHLRARACKDGLCSDFLQTVNFTYQPAGPAQGLYISVPQYLFTIQQGNTLTVPATIQNGKAPYNYTVTWGDQSVDSATSTTKNLSLAHQYSKPGRYTILISAQDADGQKGSVQLTAYVKENQFWLIVALLLVLLAPLIWLLGIFRLRQKHKI